MLMENETNEPSDRAEFFYEWQPISCRLLSRRAAVINDVNNFQAE